MIHRSRRRPRSRPGWPRRGWLAAVLGLGVLAAGPVCAAERIPVICKHGDLHRMSLKEVAPGTVGAREAPRLHMGPGKTVWLRLPGGTTLARGAGSPIAVADLDADAVDVVVVRRDGRTESVRARVSESDADGLTRAQLIQVRAESYGYLLPEGCRRLSRDEEHDYARALLNNAGCLLPPESHEALARLPGTPPWLHHDCGWDSDPRLALHLMNRAAAEGSLEAGWVASQFYLGNVAPEYRNLSAAYLQLDRAGGLGHASAQLMAGIMRWRGNGMGEADPQAAFPMLLPYAREGSREAQGIIGTMYLTGEGVPENRIQAYAWCSLAAAEAPLMYTDPVACRDAAAGDLSYDQMLQARDLAVDIHNGAY